MIEEYTDNNHTFFVRWIMTSGTSGQPFSSLAGSLSISSAYASFASFRFLCWQGKRVHEIATTKIAHIKQVYARSEHRLLIPFSKFQTDPEAVFLELAAFEPEVLVAYPSVLLDIAKMTKTRKDLPTFAPRYVISSGEMLTSSVRSFVSAQLHSEIFNRYALEEIGVIGIECSAHTGFHINSESLIVEITDDTGRSLVDGEYGRVVITDLFNYTMPFIRYDTGDHGAISHEPCVCGLHTTRLWIEGRHSAYITFGERRIHCLEFEPLDKFMNYIFQYQAAKTGEHELTLRVVPGPAFRETTIVDIEKSLKPLLGNDISVVIRLVSSIPQTERGKTNIVIDETRAGNKFRAVSTNVP